jgi:hypothetical protein
MSQKTPLAMKPMGATMEPGISLKFFFIIMESQVQFLIFSFELKA